RDVTRPILRRPPSAVSQTPDPEPLTPTFEPVEPFAALGVTACTTTRAAGDFAVPLDGPTPEIRQRFESLLLTTPGAGRIVSARQVHGRRVLAHDELWTGWRRVDGADGHVTATPGTVLAV